MLVCRHRRYDLRSQLGSGGQGTVYRAIEKETGVHYACKSIPKMLPKFSGTTPHHLLKIRSEVDTMMQMGASLDVVFLKVTVAGFIHSAMRPPVALPACTAEIVQSSLNIRTLWSNDGKLSGCWLRRKCSRMTSTST